MTCMCVGILSDESFNQSLITKWLNPDFFSIQNKVRTFSCVSSCCIAQLLHAATKSESG